MHKELFSARIKRDSDKFSKIKSWLKGNSPFKAVPQLIALDSGLTDDKNVVTRNRAEEMCALIQKILMVKPVPIFLLREKSK